MTVMNILAIFGCLGLGILSGHPLLSLCFLLTLLILDRK